MSTFTFFTEIYMQVNVSKFQYIMFGSANKLPDTYTLHIKDEIDLNPQTVKLLGVDVDQSLSFKNNISRICKKPSRRLCHILNFVPLYGSLVV